MPEIKGRTKPLEYQEIVGMFTKADARRKLLISLLYLTGGRINEILNLRAEDIMPEESRLRIDIKFSKRKDKTKYSKHTLSIPATGKVIPMLKVIYDAKMNTPPGGKVLNITRQRAWSMLKSLDSDIYPHLFRHTRATRLALAGGTGQQLKVFFGWTNSDMADQYIEATDKLIENLKVD